MMPTGVILYGPPASGKDTITGKLCDLDPRYAPFQRLKVGTGKLDGYRSATSDELSTLRAAGDVLYENQRYGNTYAIDEPHLAALLDAGRIPIVHIGQVAGIHAVRRHHARWISVLLWCSRATTARRAEARGSADVDDRLVAWDETAADIKGAGDGTFSARIESDATTPESAAALIHTWVQGLTIAESHENQQ